MADAHKNFAYSTVATAPSPAASGTSLVVAAGEGALFPAVPFNASVWPTGVQPTSANAEIVRVTGISTDTFTITRTQEGTGARTVIVGDQIAAAITNLTLTDIEGNFGNSWSPFLVQAVSALQTLATNDTAATKTGVMYFFPVTVAAPIKFNQILIGNSLSYRTSAGAATIQATHHSKFGIYSRANETLFSLISSNSFSIGLTDQSVSQSMNFPTTTHTSGYGYGSLGGTGVSTTAQRVSLWDGSRVVGLQFGGEMSLTGARYWLGLLSFKFNTAGSSTFGISHAGVIGQQLSPINMVNVTSGPPPIGVSPTEFTHRAFTDTGWYGRPIVGFITNTARGGFAGSAIPPYVSLAEIASAVSILPTVTFVST